MSVSSDSAVPLVRGATVLALDFRIDSRFRPGLSSVNLPFKICPQRGKPFPFLLLYLG